MSAELVFADVVITAPDGRTLLTIDGVRFVPGMVAITGHNGVGKSTLLRTIMALHAPRQGSIALNGMDNRADRQRFLRHAAYQPQNFASYPELSALDFLTYWQRMRGQRRREAAHLAAFWLARVGLGDAAHQPTGTFSQGMLQRLGLAYVLQMQGPVLYVLDEPFAGVDPDARAALLALLAEAAADRIVLMSTHHVDEAVAHGARLAAIVDGRLDW